MNRIILTVAAVAAALIALVLLTDDNSMRRDAPNAIRRTTTVAVIMSGPQDDGGWGSAHYRAFESIREELNLRIVYRENVLSEEDCVRSIRETIGQGARIVFATSFGFGDAIRRMADEHPDVFFYHCTGVETRRNVATYTGRMYQMRYLSGIAAGMQTENGEIGYVAALPIEEVIRGINAFTLGVRHANPRARVHVAWTDVWMNYEREREAAFRMIERHGVDVIAFHQDSDGVIAAAAEKGIFAIGYNVDKREQYPETCLTAPVWNWAPFYRRSILAVLQNNFEGKRFWGGVNSGMVALAPLAPFAKPGIAQAVAGERNRMAGREWDVFHGPIHDIAGNLRIESGSSMSDAQLFADFKWFVNGTVFD